MTTKLQEERRARAQDRAERLAALADHQAEQAMSEVKHLPPGQPILVGHHSEKRHRRMLERRNRLMDKSLRGAAILIAFAFAFAAVAIVALKQSPPRGWGLLVCDGTGRTVVCEGDLGWPRIACLGGPGNPVDFCQGPAEWVDEVPAGELWFCRESQGGLR